MNENAAKIEFALLEIQAVTMDTLSTADAKLSRVLELAREAEPLLAPARADAPKTPAKKR